jgi:hypothetical protein
MGPCLATTVSSLALDYWRQEHRHKEKALCWGKCHTQRRPCEPKFTKTTGIGPACACLLESWTHLSGEEYISPPQYLRSSLPELIFCTLIIFPHAKLEK